MREAIMRRILRRCALLLLLLTPLCARADAPVKSLTEFTAAFFAHAERLETEFEIPCEYRVLDQLFGGSVIDDFPLLLRIAANSGMYDLAYYRYPGAVSIYNCRYYEGVRIFRSWREGNTSILTERERKALDVAQQMVAAVSGDDLARERQLHDALCARVVYDSSGPDDHQERDCALGVLLGDRADCDGYSDAFALLCNLAGLPAYIVQGRTVPWRDDQADLSAQDKNVGHAWNVIRVNGRWVMTDITWNDNDRDISYIYYNNGQDRHLETHIWDDRALPFTVEASAGNELRPADLRRYTVVNWDELYPLVREAAEAGVTRLSLEYPESFDLYRQRSALSDCMFSMGARDFRWGFGGRCAEIHAIHYYEHFRVCDTADQVLAYIDECSRQNIRSFSVYFYPPLDGQLFADGHLPLMRLLAQSRVERLYYSYNEDTGHVGFEDADFLPAFPALDGWEAAAAYVRAQARLHSSPIAFWSPETLSKDALSTLLYSLGAYTFTLSENTGRYVLNKIIYYPEFRIVSSRQEIVDYLAWCRKNGVTDFRIYCPQDIFNALLANSARELHDLLRQAGLRDQKISYSAAYLMIEISKGRW